MSLNHTFQPGNPGDSATDLTFPGEDQAHGHSDVTRDHVSAAGASASIDSQMHDNTQALFPSAQAADEQDLEVDVCITSIIGRKPRLSALEND